MNPHTSPSFSDLMTLWRLWLTKPGQIAALAPSGAGIRSALVDAVNDRSGLVVELGAGTGPITAGLLRAGVERDRLVAVEADHIPHARLRRRFGRRDMLCLDARTLGPTLARSLERRDCEHVGAIVSTLPLLNFSPTGRRAVLDSCFSHAAPDARFTQVTCFPGSPVRQRRLCEWGYRAERWRRVRRHCPPVTLWQYCRA